MNLIKSVWNFLGIFQSKYMRLFHVIVFLSIIIQILITNWMYVPNREIDPFSSFSFFTFCTWLHILLGLINIILVPLFIIYCFRTRGLVYFYPYLFNDFRGLKNDCMELIKFKLPKMDSSGLASSVEGLGLGALLIAVFTGFIWFLTWFFNYSNSLFFLSLHKSLTILIEIYIIGHGSMAILHFILWRKKALL